MDSWDDGLHNLIEPVPVDDIFLTGMCKIETLGDGGVIRSWFYTEEAGTRILRAKLVIPLACAAIMNLHGTHVFTQMLRNRPHIAKLVVP